MAARDTLSPNRISTGLTGLDQILHGGLPAQELYLVQGAPGTGKTTLGMHFLLAGEPESSLYLTLSQTHRSLEQIARSHGWSPGQLQIVEMNDLFDGEDRSQSIFPSYEVELRETMEAIRAVVERTNPDRLVIDAVTDLRSMASDAIQFRRQLIQLRYFLHEHSCTTLFLDEPPSADDTRELENQVHGIISLEQVAPTYGEVRRRLQVLKMRGSSFFSGYHNFTIETGGLHVYPRVQANGQRDYDRWSIVPSGVSGLDAMLGGGLRAGTSTLIVGPTGSGKTALGFQFAVRSALDGDPSAIFLFDERLQTFEARADGMEIDLRRLQGEGKLIVEQINTGKISPSEFAQRVRRAVEEKGARVVFIDSLTGYLNAMQQEEALIPQLHELLIYLGQQGVLSLMVVAQHGQSLAHHVDPTQLSYMSDTILMLRYNEQTGRLRRTISVLKQRHSAHDESARELFLSSSGIEVGQSMNDFVGLTLDPPVMTTLQPAPNDKRESNGT